MNQLGVNCNDLCTKPEENLIKVIVNNRSRHIIIIMTKTKLIIFFLAAFSILLESSNQFQHTVYLVIEPTNEITSDFAIDPVTPDGTPADPTPTFTIGGSSQNKKSQTITAYYSFDTNEENKKITAMLNEGMPEGASLTAYLTPAPGCRTTGTQTLATNPTDMIVDISRCGGQGLPIYYTMSVEKRAPVAPLQSRVIIYTLTDG